MVMEMVGWFLGGYKVVDHGGGCYLGLYLTDNLIENLTNTLSLLTQSYKTYLPQTNNQLRTSSNTRNQATVQDDKVVVQNVQGQQNKGQWNNARGTSAAGNEGAQDRVGTINPGQENGVVLDEERLLFIAGGQDNDVYEDMDKLPVQDLIMFMANLSSAYPVYDEAGPSYDLDILSETAQSVSIKVHTKVVDASLTVELAIYKEQVKLYEIRAEFELTEREQKIKEQSRIVITDCNIKEDNLKKEIHSIKMQLNSTINHNKSMVEEVTSLKKDFKQKENKYLEEFLDMKTLKEKVEDKLFKQD
nr:hypothetical protein [Tanacetum cinerariifolium]